MGGYDPTDVIGMSKSRSGGAASTVPMVTGQETPSPGPQANFKDPADSNRYLAQPYTVRFGVSSPNIGTEEGQYANFDAVAIIISMVEGVQIQRIVTIAQGVAISGTAQAVDVKIQDITSDSDIFGLPYTVFVQVVPGIRSGYAQPPTLEAFTSTINGADNVASGTITLNAGVAAVYPVPFNAGVISVEVVSPNGAPVVTHGTPNGNYKQYTASDGTVFGFEPLAPNSAFVTVTNTGGDAIDVTLTWGIEG
jgi:hypothetical protein